MEDSEIVLYIIGGAALLFIVALLFNNRNAGVTSQSSQDTKSVLSGNVESSSPYYNDIPNKPVNPTPLLTPIVQNEESIKWTDWLGRERVITISRKVH